LERAGLCALHGRSTSRASRPQANTRPWKRLAPQVSGRVLHTPAELVDDVVMAHLERRFTLPMSHSHSAAEASGREWVLPPQTTGGAWPRPVTDHAHRQRRSRVRAAPENDWPLPRARQAFHGHERTSL